MPTIAIFGISGRTGEALTAAARAREWPIRSFGRISSVAPMGAAVIRGDFTDRGHVTNVIRGTEAVCLAFGPRPPYTDVFCAAATQAVIAAMHDVGCPRLLCLTGAMIGPLAGRSRPMEWASALFRKRYPAIARDRDEQEDAVLQSGLTWTIIKPPRLTTDAATGRMAATPDLRVGLLSHLSRADLAEFMLDEIEHPRFAGQRVVVCNAK